MVLIQADIGSGIATFSADHEDIIAKTGIPYRRKENVVSVEGTNMIDFIGAYDGNLSRIYQNLPVIKVFKCSEDAVVPSKARESDVGYDLTIIRLHKKLRDDVYMYGTGIKLGIPLGYYVEVVPRSSLSKSGWMLANSVGIIDASYTGEIFVALVKIDPTANMDLPFKGFQLVLKKQEYAVIVESDVDNVAVTARGNGGFGSTT